MKIIDYSEPIDKIEKEKPIYLTHYYGDERVLYFDIETTGFSAHNTTLYLIGVLWYENNSIKIRQWFNDDGKCEVSVIKEFNNFCNDFTLLVHFNGSGFDIPYLKQKALAHKINFTADSHLFQLDIFKEIRKYKELLRLDNMKQKAIENYLEINREDKYNGRELINVYQRYVAHPDEEKETLLLLHNHDDLLGMPQITHILNYKAFFDSLEECDISVKNVSANDNTDKLEINFCYPSFASVSKRIAHTCNGIYLNALETEASLVIPIINDTLKHYFASYKDYFYLPGEDMAIHKSVAAYVEQDNKEKATKSTCYIKVTDAFIPCFSMDNSELFQYDYRDKTSYQKLSSFLSLNESDMAGYIIQILKSFV